MCRPNPIGSELAQIEGITAITDVTGFGLLGHLGEICEGSGIAAIIDYDAVPKISHVEEYLAMGCSPGGAQRNFDSYGDKISAMTQQQQAILCDPQTSGGLLVAVKPEAVKLFLEVTGNAGLQLSPIGERVEDHDGPLIKVIGANFLSSMTFAVSLSTTSRCWMYAPLWSIKKAPFHWRRITR